MSKEELREQLLKTLNDGVVELLNVEAPREFKVSDADTILASL